MKDIKTCAKQLAHDHAESEPGLKAIFLFPNKDEIRLIEVDETTGFSGEVISPFYFSSDPLGGINFPLSIALIHPEEKDTIGLPEEWHTNWNAAEQIWPEETN